jgi:hypothetical protein
VTETEDRDRDRDRDRDGSTAGRRPVRPADGMGGPFGHGHGSYFI